MYWRVCAPGYGSAREQRSGSQILNRLASGWRRRTSSGTTTVGAPFVPCGPRAMYAAAGAQGMELAYVGGEGGTHHSGSYLLTMPLTLVVACSVRDMHYYPGRLCIHVADSRRGRCTKDIA
jgi:hypothetical protein